MRILFVADWRSIIARQWVLGICSLGHECHVVSSFPTEAGDDPVCIDEIPIALASLAGTISRSNRMLPSSRPGTNSDPGADDQPVPPTRDLRRSSNRRSGRPSSLAVEKMRTSVHRHVAPRDLVRHLPAAQKVVHAFRPQIVHALRIPFEAMFGTLLTGGHRTVVSIWGNDLTLHAPTTKLMRRHTWRTLTKADGLISDCVRDINLSRSWGYPAGRPTIVLPGNGGISVPTNVRDLGAHTRSGMGLAPETPVVFSPRGPRVYLRLANFIHALPSILRADPRVVFVFADCTHNRLRDLARDLGVEKSCRFLSHQSADRMLELFGAADVFVSPSVHDGTPNTLIEGMSAACFPVAGDTASIREWIVPGENGLLCDPESPVDIAAKVVSALADRPLRERATEQNRTLVTMRAGRAATLQSADEFYHQIAGSDPPDQVDR